MNDELRKFWRALYDHFYVEERGELDECDFADTAVVCGLLQSAIYNPSVHGDIADAEMGDIVYVPTDAGRAALCE